MRDSGSPTPREGGGRMFKFRGCPRCHGDLMIDKDQYGWYEECMQCGFSRDLRSVLSDEKKEEMLPRKRRAHRARITHAG